MESHLSLLLLDVSRTQTNGKLFNANNENDSWSELSDIRKNKQGWLLCSWRLKGFGGGSCRRVLSRFRILSSLTRLPSPQEHPRSPFSSYRSWYLEMCGQMNGTFRSCVVDASDGINFRSHRRSFLGTGWRQYRRRWRLLRRPTTTFLLFNFNCAN